MLPPPFPKALRRRVVVGLATLERVDPQTQINGPANAWVVKPCGAARGEGVKVTAPGEQTAPATVLKKSEIRRALLRSTPHITSSATLPLWPLVLMTVPLIFAPAAVLPPQVVDSMDRILSELQTGPPRIVQKYVERPLLLGKTKADLRVWVVVLSFEPLVAYIYDQVSAGQQKPACFDCSTGPSLYLKAQQSSLEDEPCRAPVLLLLQVMIRPASEAFTLVPDQLSNTAIHLCNHSVQGALSGKRQQVDKLGPRRPASRAGSPARRMRSPDPQADRPRTTKSRPESVYATSMFHSPLGKRCDAPERRLPCNHSREGRTATHKKL